MNVTTPVRASNLRTSAQRRTLYRAFVENQREYEGVVFVAVKTTGVFCRPGCTARKPKFENCEFFDSAQDALLAGFRPCKRCKPLSLPGEPSRLIKSLIEAVESSPEHHWTDADFRERGIDSSTVRRQFKQRFGMTFVAYARARRMGLAMRQIRDGQSIIETQLNTGYRSGSGFRDAFARILGAPPSGFAGPVFHAKWIDTPLGSMLALASDRGLALLEFTDRRGLEREIERLRAREGAAIVPGDHPVLQRIHRELASYFAGKLRTFETPLDLKGTDFQKEVWQALLRIPIGETRSYAQQAQAIGRPEAVRAVARANGANQIAIVVPCHRVIGSNGELTGYAGGLPRKRWLIEHEGKVAG